MSGSRTYSNYDAFAWFYNRYWSRDVPSQIMTAIERLLLPHLPRHARILDLCCGTGYTVSELSRRGYEVTGLDASEEMLGFARRNAPGARLLRADARAFTLPPVHHAVISTFDSLNHVMRLEELTTVFNNTFHALAPAGIFLFDMNMEKAFLHHWDDYFAIVEETNACILRGDYDRQQGIGRYDITMFRRRGGQWQRADAVITERCYTRSEIRRALKAAGFDEVTTYDAVRDAGLSDHVGRSFFLARKSV